MKDSSIDHVRLFEGADHQWYYETRAGNRRVLSTSEGYTRKADALRALGAEHPGVAVVEEHAYTDADVADAGAVLGNDPAAGE